MEIVKSKIIPVKRRDIDTDLIIPADYLKVTDKAGLGDHLLESIADEIELDKFKGREILVAGENFGCGSSREHAAWALADFGVKVVIAPSFADIFYNNALKNLILPIVLDQKFVENLYAFEGEILVNIAAQTVGFADYELGFSIDTYRKQCLLQEMDDFDYLFSNIDAIKAFDEKRAKNLFLNLELL